MSLIPLFAFLVVGLLVVLALATVALMRDRR